ncbi:MAG: hypothetical protein V7K92_15175 [Nostoc sp.]|uniref:hypothetical protein n=1 Tax=Nostoc sp. TaxID=1180 RepID=UPI002FF06EEB
MKKLLSLILLGLFPVAFVLSPLKPAAAYCIFNDSDKDITAFQLPIDADSFKQVIGPKQNKCCNWQDTSCTSEPHGRFDKTSFVLFKGSTDVSAITASKVLEGIAGALGQVIPVVGPAVKELTDQIFASLDTYFTKDSGIGVIGTYNGGVIVYNGTDAFGCWTGSCIGNDVNGDGSTGVPSNP